MKERLTGAIILVALIVLLVPELLTGPLRSTVAAGGARPEASLQSRAARSSAANLSVLHGSPALPFLSVRPAPAAKSEARPAARPPIHSYTLALRPSAPRPGISRAADEGALPEPPPESAPAPPHARALRHSSPASARAAASIVAGPRPASHGGLPSSARAPSRRASPVRAVRPQPPVPAPSRNPPRASARWVVQLASFTDRANAQRLVERLRLQHLPATIAPLRLRGRMWWRVWVGPQSRAAAGRLAQRLRPIARGEVLHE